MFTGLADAKVAPTSPIGCARARVCVCFRVRAGAGVHVHVSEVEVARLLVDGVRRVLRERAL